MRHLKVKSLHSESVVYTISFLDRAHKYGGPLNMDLRYGEWQVRVYNGNNENVWFYTGLIKRGMNDKPIFKCYESLALTEQQLADGDNILLAILRACHPTFGPPPLTSIIIHPRGEEDETGEIRTYPHGC